MLKSHLNQHVLQFTGEVLVEQAKSVLIMTHAAEHIRNKLQRHKEEVSKMSIHCLS